MTLPALAPGLVIEFHRLVDPVPAVNALTVADALLVPGDADTRPTSGRAFPWAAVAQAHDSTFPRCTMRILPLKISRVHCASVRV